MSKNTNERISRKKHIAENDIINCKVLKYDKKYNLIVELDKGIKGIIYRNDLSLEVNEEGKVPESIVIGYLNRNIKVKVKQIIDDDDYKYILSRKDIEIDSRKWVQDNLKEGMTIVGKVLNIKPYGVFIEILDGVIGLLHIEDISVVRTRHPSERLKIGQKIHVLIKSYDKSTNRIFLSHKELLGTWEENVSRFKEGTEVNAIAREREKNGIFIELTPNLVGLAEHKSGIEYGQNVKVYIKKIVPEKKKIKLVIV